MRDDHVTSTERDASLFEWVFGADERRDFDDRPTRREIEAEGRDYSWDPDGSW